METKIAIVIALVLGFALGMIVFLAKNQWMMQMMFLIIDRKEKQLRDLEVRTGEKRNESCV